MPDGISRAVIPRVAAAITLFCFRSTSIPFLEANDALEASTSIEARDSQSIVIPKPIVLTEAGMRIVVRPLWANARSPIVVSD